MNVFAWTNLNVKKEKANIRFRISDGRDVELSYTSKILIEAEKWDRKRQCVKQQVAISKMERDSINKRVLQYKELLNNAYEQMLQDGAAINSKTIKEYMINLLYPNYVDKKKNNILEVFDNFLAAKNFEKQRQYFFNGIKQTLERYIRFYSISPNINTFDKQRFENFFTFIMQEYQLYKKRPDLYKDKNGRTPKQKSINTLHAIELCIKEFLIWAVNNEKITKNPLLNFTPHKDKYGTPFYLTIEERNKIYNCKEYKRKKEIQYKDIFIFQCCVGCRVSDLWKMKNKNIINGAIEYVASKTKENTQKTIRVPLNSLALEILEKYKEKDENAKILPFGEKQTYNDYIKKICKTAGIDRMITVFNSTKNDYEQRPLYEKASSHLARRTFIGNLYKKVQDPNLIGSLSGHVEGSKAFARYRTIDENMKIELVKMLE